MHLSSEKIFFAMVICHKCLEHCCFFSRPFFEASHVSAGTLQLKFQGMKFFSSILGNWNIFLERFKVFCITHKKIEKYDGKNMKHASIMYCFNFFRNQWMMTALISYNSFKNVNMCLLEEAIYEKCRCGHFQSEGGVKSFRIWGLKKFRTGGSYFCWGRGQYSITCHEICEHIISNGRFKSTTNTS